MTSIMKEPNPNATIQIGAVDLGEGPDKVSLEDAIAKAKGRRTQPPPLPEEHRASQVPPVPTAPAANTPNAPRGPAGRGPFFYIAVLLGVVIVGVIGGTMLLRATAKPPAKPPASPSVITIPTVEVE